MSVKSERITILGSPSFKAFLVKEAKKEKLSISELVRRRCENSVISADEKILAALVAQVNESVRNTSAKLNKSLTKAERILAELSESSR